MESLTRTEVREVLTVDDFGAMSVSVGEGTTISVNFCA